MARWLASAAWNGSARTVTLRWEASDRSRETCSAVTTSTSGGPLCSLRRAECAHRSDAWHRFREPTVDDQYSDALVAESRPRVEVYKDMRVHRQAGSEALRRRAARRPGVCLGLSSEGDAPIALIARARRALRHGSIRTSSAIDWRPRRTNAFAHRANSRQLAPPHPNLTWATFLFDRRDRHPAGHFPTGVTDHFSTGRDRRRGRRLTQRGCPGSAETNLGRRVLRLAGREFRIRKLPRHARAGE